MVKLLFVFLLCISATIADETKEIDALTQKIQTFIEPQVYEQNKAYINILFTPSSQYYVGERIDAVKVTQTLKENGLLNLFFKKPSELILHFKTSGSPLFFVKIMGDTLRNIGYYRYVTKESNLDNSEFTWTISLTSEYATDPRILQNELAKSGCSIVDIDRENPTEWTYIIDMRDGRLNVEILEEDMEIKLKRSLYAKWVDVSNIKKLRITSSPRNSWYPYIAYYDSSMHLLKVIKRDRRRSKMILSMKENTYYLKISDIYTLKNIRDDLVLTPIGSR
ncbi:hypothetical protein [Sulfurimonas sp.]|uniref:hypothetical protein n=1 Tax=Sulfurimonas sp. TaxID=2022749 RepID=UPI002B4617A1|nr:hypothetical protein [Sulfurimonas sp.]